MVQAVVSSLQSASAIDSRVAEIIESAIGRLQHGKRVEIEDLVAEHPEHAAKLRELLPTVLTMVRLGDATSDLAEPPNALNGDASRRLGDFRIVRELGRGGMGVVYEAEQISMGRHVALKVLPFVALAHENSLQRFRNEVRAAAALDHPNIVSVYSVGEERGVHYYAMQLVRGRSLAELIEERKRSDISGQLSVEQSSDALATDNGQLPTDTQSVAAISTIPHSSNRGDYKTAARLGRQAAQALQHAHDQGVVHRDIKPSNLLVDDNEKLYVTDFGLARIEADASLTTTGDVIGTLRYMAPEQALAKRVVVDHRADVYSLGATLYELLTLEPVFAETDRAELLRRIAFDEPWPPRRLDRRIPAELEIIVLKAMAKSPEDRYQTVDQLAEDLQAFLDNRPIKAKSPTVLQRIMKWSRRHVAAVWAVAAILFALAVTLVMANVRIAKWYQEARRQEQSARAVSDFLTEILATANPNRAKRSDYTVRELLDDFSNSLGEQFLDQPEVEATLRLTVASAYHGLGLAEQADPHFKKALELRRGAFDVDSVGVADVLTGYAWNLYDLGRPDLAFSLLEQAFAIYRRNGNPPEQTLSAMTTMHNFLSWNYDFEKADALAEEALKIAGDLDSVQIPCVANFAHGLARSKLGQGDYVAAEALARKAVSLHRRLQGDHHPETGWGLTVLGLTLRQQMKLAEAESAQREALMIFRRNYDDAHKSVQCVLIRLARVLAAQGNLQQAKSMRDEAIAGCDQAIRKEIAIDTTLAWYLATDNINELRDGASSLRFAKYDCKMGNYRDPNNLGILAAAYAEIGDFESAIKWSEKAIGLTTSDKQRDELSKRLDRYRQNEPWRIDY